MSKSTHEVVDYRIESFEKRFGKAHLYFSYHAAFPLAITPNILYRLWANFQRDINGKALNIPWIAVADLLLSNLCDEVGHELYEMDLTVRNLLLSRLQEDENFGQQRINELSDFMLDYVRQQLQNDDPDIRDFAQNQRLIALAYTQPTQAVYELSLAFSKLDYKDKAELLRLASLTEIVFQPLVEFQPLLIYARAMGNLARGEIEAAIFKFSEILAGKNQVWVAGVSLPIPKQIKEVIQSSNIDIITVLSYLNFRLVLAVVVTVVTYVGFYQVIINLSACDNNSPFQQQILPCPSGSTPDSTPSIPTRGGVRR